jgi:hypothetical protein
MILKCGRLTRHDLPVMCDTMPINQAPCRLKPPFPSSLGENIRYTLDDQHFETIIIRSAI